MTETEYIYATDTRSLDLALDALRHVIPENNTHVPRDEFNMVIIALQQWLGATRRAMKIK